jgi:hypothetical protein
VRVARKGVGGIVEEERSGLESNFSHVLVRMREERHTTLLSGKDPNPEQELKEKRGRGGNRRWRKRQRATQHDQRGRGKKEWQLV